MTQLDERVRGALDAMGVSYEVLPCEEHLADTEAFSKHYGFPMENNANTILVASKRGRKGTPHACCWQPRRWT
jgi:hypothetical protein